MKRSPLKPTRTTPRRNEGRITHERQRPRAGAKPTAEERAHIARIRAMPCIVPGCPYPATAHHVTGYADRIGRVARSHRRLVPLCNGAPHHQRVYDSASDPQSVESLSHRGFFDKFSVDLLAEADRLWEARNQ